MNKQFVYIIFTEIPMYMKYENRYPVGITVKYVKNGRWEGSKTLLTHLLTVGYSKHIKLLVALREISKFPPSNH